MAVDVLSSTDSGHLMATLCGLCTRLRGQDHRATLRTGAQRRRDVTLAGPEGDARICRLIDSVYRVVAWRLILRPDVPEAPLLTLDTDHPPVGDRLRLAINDGWVLPGEAA